MKSIITKGCGREIRLGPAGLHLKNGESYVGKGNTLPYNILLLK